MLSSSMAIVVWLTTGKLRASLIRQEDPEASVDEQSVIHGKPFLHSEEFCKLIRVTLLSPKISAIRNDLN